MSDPSPKLSAMSPVTAVESLLWHLVSLSFIATLVVVWLFMYTFHPGLFFSDNDFITALGSQGVEGDGTADGDHKVFSDKGRSACFLWSFVIALVVSVIVWFVFRRQ